MRRFVRILTLTLVALCGVGSAHAWPSLVDYNHALRRGGSAFKDPGLREGTILRSTLGPVPMPGGVAAVYQVTDTAGKKWAVRVFTKQPKHERHEANAETVSALGKKNGLFPHVEYQADGIEVMERGVKKKYPIMKMEWVEGERLEAHVHSLLAKKDTAKIDQLAEQWREAHATLRAAGAGHGDLQHANILVTPQGKLKLIDLDDLYVRGKQNGAHGFGSPMYAHPKRGEGDHSVDIDNFPSLLIYTSLKAVAADPSLWHDDKIHIADNNGGGDNLIFQPADLNEPSKSLVFKRLAASPSPIVRALGGRIVELLAKHVSEVPPLEALLGNEKWTPDGKLPNGKKPSGTVEPLAIGKTAKPIKAAVVEVEEEAEPVVKTRGTATKPAAKTTATKAKKAAEPVVTVAARKTSGPPGPNASAAEWQVYRMEQLRNKR